MSRPSISQLNSGNNFQTWFNTTNSLITEVNFLNSTGITGITGGNGIGVTTDGDRNYSVRFTGNVSGNVTFSGPVTFLNSLSASSINVSTTKLSYSPKKSGLTAGNIVRIDSSVGLTFAKADSADNAEVLGVIVGEDASYNYIAVAGQIDNSTFSNTIRNALNIVGGTLGNGVAYFLSPTVAGGITSIEPVVYGQVSKPVLLGITGNSGVILPYRGIVIEGITAGITAELDNKIIIEIDYGPLVASGFTVGSNIASPTPIKIGDTVFYETGSDSLNLSNILNVVEVLQQFKTSSTVKSGAAVKLAGLDQTQEIGYWIPDWVNCTGFTYTYQGGDDWDYYIGAQPVENKRILGLVSNIIATPTSLGGGATKYILEVTLPGGAFDVNFADLDTLGLYPDGTTDLGGGILGLSAGTYYWSLYCPITINSTTLINPYTGKSESGFGFNKIIHDSAFPWYENFERYRFLDIIKYSPTSGKIIFHYETQRQFKSTDYGDESSAKILAFASPSSGSSSGITANNSYNYLPNGSFSVWQRPFSGYSGATVGTFTNTYIIPIADRWYFTNHDELVGLTLDLKKKQFDSDQTNVPGSPLYYVDIKTQYTGVGSTLEYRPRLENIQKSARLLQGQTATLSFYAKSTVLGATLDITFNRYDEGIVTDNDFITALNSRTSVVSGISLSTSWKKYAQAFVVPVMGSTLTPEQDGWISFGFEFPNSTATISLAQASLEAGYGSNSLVYVNQNEELERCKPYYQRTYDLDEAAQSTNSRGNEEILTLGNMNSQIVYPIKFPTKMIETPAEIKVYSSTTGTPTEAYNVNAGQDLRYTTGTLIGYPWDVTPQYRQGAGLTGNTTIPNSSTHGFDIQINSGAVSFDTLKFHWIADADLLYRG